MTTVFQRNAADEISDPSIQMPHRILETSTHQFPIDVLAQRLEQYLADPSSVQEKYPWAARIVMGFPVSSWQRHLVWHVGQKARFISAVWSGAGLGSYLTNEWLGSSAGSKALAENSEILIDGQQRLHSLEEYFMDRLAVPDAQGQPRTWSEVGNSERKRFLSTIFAHSTVCSDDELALRKTYDLYAQGLVPRAHDQRAVQ
ncbi:DUF262 domain-containing protein [Pseudomonas sp. NPDC087336]|uniref:DUF262 domain-containing protein n=1 Tax=Pseudomonas sp. NPDC087336 TaxID=3364436 RepID=UPI00381DF176